MNQNLRVIWNKLKNFKRNSIDWNEEKFTKNKIQFKKKREDKKYQRQIRAAIKRSKPTQWNWIRRNALTLPTSGEKKLFRVHQHIETNGKKSSKSERTHRQQRRNSGENQTNTSTHGRGENAHQKINREVTKKRKNQDLPTPRERKPTSKTKFGREKTSLNRHPNRSSSCPTTKPLATIKID